LDIFIREVLLLSFPRFFFYCQFIKYSKKIIFQKLQNFYIIFIISHITCNSSYYTFSALIVRLKIYFFVDSCFLKYFFYQENNRFLSKSLAITSSVSLFFNVISGRLLVIVIAKHRVAIHIFPVTEKRDEGRRGESVERRERGVKVPLSLELSFSLFLSCLLDLHSRRVSTDDGESRIRR